MVDVNILAVIVAAIASFVLGMLWFSPVLFGKAWMKEMGITAEKIEASKKKGMAKEMIVAVINAIVAAYVLAYFLGIAALAGVGSPITIAILIWLGFMATIFVDGVLWEEKSMRLFAIQSGNRLAAVILMTLIVGLWN